MENILDFNLIKLYNCLKRSYLEKGNQQLLETEVLRTVIRLYLENKVSITWVGGAPIIAALPIEHEQLTLQLT